MNTAPVNASQPCIQTDDQDTVCIPRSEWIRLHALDLADRRRQRNRAHRKAHPVQDGVASVTRQVRALGRQEVPRPRDFVALTTELRNAEAVLVRRWVEEGGASWIDVGREYGISHQAARQRFGGRVQSARKRGGQTANLRGGMRFD